MVDLLIIIALIILAIFVIIELVNYKVVPQFNIINLFFHLFAAYSIITVGNTTAIPDAVRAIFISLGLTGLSFGFHTQKRPKKISKEVEP